MQFTRAAECASYGSSPAKIVRIRFEGIDRTKDWAIKTETQDLFKIKTFRELVVKAYETKLQMEKDGLFENVVVIVDVDHSQNADQNGFEVLFIAKEPSRHKVKNRKGLIF